MSKILQLFPVLDILQHQGVIASCDNQLEILDFMWTGFDQFRKCLDCQADILLSLIAIEGEKIFAPDLFEFGGHFVCFLFIRIKLPEIYGRIEHFDFDLGQLVEKFEVFIEDLFGVFAIHVNLLRKQQ